MPINAGFRPTNPKKSARWRESEHFRLESITDPTPAHVAIHRGPRDTNAEPTRAHVVLGDPLVSEGVHHFTLTIRWSRLGGGIGMRLGVAESLPGEANERGPAWGFRPSDGRLSVHSDATEEGVKGDPLMEGDLQNRAMGVRVEVVVDMRLRALGFSVDGGRLYDAAVQLPTAVRPMCRLFYRGDAIMISDYGVHNPSLLSLQMPRLAGGGSPVGGRASSPRSGGSPRSGSPRHGRSGSPTPLRASGSPEVESRLRRELAEERRQSARLRKRVDELGKENWALLARERTMPTPPAPPAATGRGAPRQRAQIPEAASSAAPPKGLPRDTPIAPAQARARDLRLRPVGSSFGTVAGRKEV